MKNLKINKLERVDCTDKELLEQGVVAFQLVEVLIPFYGTISEETLDTKIYSDGRQVFTDGNGFIPAGTEL